ncbi:MAG: SIMPL domain-containing protein [Rhodoplanes sp.]|nr:SIMPL domain-containing protein [Rhodoplanes sp.]
MAAMLAFAPPAGAQDRRGGTAPTMVVRGSGTFEVKPDIAILTVVVTTTGDTLERAAKAHEERATRAATALQQLAAEGVEIGRADFDLAQRSQPRPSTTAQKPEEPSFRASTTFHLKLRNVARTNDIVTRIASTGIIEVRMASFQVENESQALNEARREAVRDAREQAEVYAAAAGVRLVEVVEIEGDLASSTGAAHASLGVERSVKIIPPAVVSFRANVTVKWRIGPRL